MKKIITFVFIFIFHYSLLILNSYSQWVQMSSGINNNLIIYSLCASDSIIFMGTDGNGIFLSTNSGLNWIQSGLETYTVTKIIVNGNNIIASAFYLQQPYGNQVWNIYFSTNNGISWIPKGLSNQVIFSLTSIGSNIFAGVNYFGVYLSTNNGTNWTQTSLINKRVDALSTNGNNLFAGTYGSGLYMSTNNGTNWANIGFYGQNVNSVAAIGSNIYTSINWWGIYFSTDFGVNWTQSNITSTRSDEIITYGNNIFVGNYAYYGLGGVYMSTNNGTNFIDISQGLNGHPTVYTLCISNSYIFAGISQQSVWRRSLSEILGIQNISTEIPSANSLEQNYPNPFNPVTKIRFAIPKNEIVTLKIIDLLGREVAVLVNEKLQSGTYETTFDANNLSSGFYFYRLQTNVYTETKRMILVK